MQIIRAGLRDSADVTAGSPRPACSAHAADVDFEFLESIRKRKRYLGVVVRVVVHGAIQCIHHSEIQRSEEHTSELQSRLHLVCRLLLEKKKKKTKYRTIDT